MRSLIKIYGPPVLKAIRALETLAVDLRNIRIMNTIILRDVPTSMARREEGLPRERGAAPRTSAYHQAWVSSYFRSFGVSVPVERTRSLISAKGEILGDHDFCFEWIEEPSTEQVLMLVEKIDEAMHDLGCYYTLTTME
jgi:hypothetical protein